MRLKRQPARRIYVHHAHYASAAKPTGQRTRRWLDKKLLVAAILVVIVLGGIAFIKLTRASSPASDKTIGTTAAKSESNQSASNPAPVPKKTASAVNYCQANTLQNLIVVSIGKRHLWACQTTRTVYDSAVVTGMENLPADLTPTGTYHIYSKQTKLYLNGSDSTGSWHDYVYYWMPFLSNQYGVYGFHDATWRKPGDFGNISPYTSNASHGCVETPLATAKWLYNWAPVGTAVSIQS